MRACSKDAAIMSAPPRGWTRGSSSAASARPEPNGVFPFPRPSVSAAARVTSRPPFTRLWKARARDERSRAKRWSNERAPSSFKETAPAPASVIGWTESHTHRRHASRSPVPSLVVNISPAPPARSVRTAPNV